MKKTYTQPTLVIHGDMASYTQQMNCENSDIIGGVDGTAFPTKHGPSGILHC